MKRISELSAEAQFRAIIASMAELTLLLRDLRPGVEAQWGSLAAEGREMLWDIDAKLRKMLIAGSPQPKSLRDKIWAGFTNDVRVTIWEFVEASRDFLTSVDAITAMNDQANWERLAFNAPALSAMHQRSVTAVENGQAPLALSLEDLRHHNTS